MMTVRHILDELKRIKNCREELAKFYNSLEENRDEACKLLRTNLTNINDTFMDTVDILSNLELLFRNKIEKIEVDI